MHNPEHYSPWQHTIHRQLRRATAATLLVVGVTSGAFAQSDDPAAALDVTSERQRALLEENQLLTKQKQALTLTIETLQEHQAQLDLERQQLVDERTRLEQQMAAAASNTPPFEIQWQATPEYPSEAASSGLEGFVDLEFSLAADGTIGDIRVIDSNPSAVFDHAAIDAVSQWIIDNHSEQTITLQKRIEFQVD